MPPSKDVEEMEIMKITGVLVDMIVGLDSDMYRKHLLFENVKKVIYAVVLREIYGMLLAELLFYNKFGGELENIGFELNIYDPCVANRIKVGKKHTVRFHVNDIMSCHVNPKVNDKFKEWMNRNNVKHVKEKSNRGKVHEYPGVTFDFTEKSKVKIKMDNYVERMINELPIKISKSDTALTPYGNNIFEKGNRKSMVTKETEELHTSVARGNFVDKRGRLDIHQMVTVLSMRFKEPNETNWQSWL